MKNSMMVAVSENGIIGHNMKLPWHLPADLRHFKKTTIGHHLIMGRKTYQSIGKPLPGRTSIVVTRQIDFSAPGCKIAHGCQQALEIARANQEQEAFIIGGGDIFREMLPVTDRIYLTLVHEKFTGDTFFELDKKDWRQLDAQSFSANDKNPHSYTFYTYERKIREQDNCSDLLPGTAK